MIELIRGNDDFAAVARGRFSTAKRFGVAHTAASCLPREVPGSGVAVEV